MEIAARIMRIAEVFRVRVNALPFLE